MSTSALAFPIITKLPDELLDLVWHYAAETNRPQETFLLKSGTESSPSFYKPDIQVNISGVCREWRRRALALPTLWNTIHIRSRSHINRARQFLSRVIGDKKSETNSLIPLSRQLEILILTVDYETYSEGEGLWRDELDEIFTILAPHTRRWRAFHLQVRDGDCKAIARKYIGTQHENRCGPAPNLITWQLYHFERFAEPEDLHEATHRPPVICFEDQIPKLQHLSLIGVNLPWNSPYLKDLISLELCLHRDNVRPSFEIWHNMLTNSPRLKRLFLHYSGPRFGEPDPTGLPPIERWKQRPIVLPELEHFTLADIEPDYLEAITSSLRFPNVKRLEVELIIREDDTNDSYNDWIRSISSSGMPPHFQSLTSLTLTRLDCSQESLRLFLATLVELKELEVQYYVWNTSVWKIFVEDLKLQEVTQSNGITGVCAPSHGLYASPPLLLPKLEVVKVKEVREQEGETHYCNVKLLLRLREREMPRLPRESTSTPPPPDRASFAIVGTLPVKVMPLSSDDISTDRNRQTNVLRRLARADHFPGRSSSMSTLGEEVDGDRSTNWKVIVDVEDISDADGVGSEDDEDEYDDDLDDEDVQEYEDEDEDEDEDEVDN